MEDACSDFEIVCEAGLHVSGLTPSVIFLINSAFKSREQACW